MGKDEKDVRVGDQKACEGSPDCRAQKHRSRPDTMCITEAQQGNCVHGCCCHCSSETNGSVRYLPLFSLLFILCFLHVERRWCRKRGNFVKKKKKRKGRGRSIMTKYKMGHWDTQDIRLRCEGRRRLLLQKSSTHTKNGN